MPIGQVIPSPDNPRNITDKAVTAVAKSLAEFGWQQPLVTDEKYELIVGHTRLQAAKSLGATEVPVVVAHGLTEGQKRAYRIADNRTGEYVSWDFTELSRQLEELSDDFSDVLGLADWQAVVASLDDIVTDVPQMPLDDETIGTMTDEANVLQVTFSDEESKIAAERVIFDLPGVVDVRRKR